MVKMILLYVVSSMVYLLLFLGIILLFCLFLLFSPFSFMYFLYLYFTKQIENIYSPQFLSKQSVIHDLQSEHKETWTDGIHDISLEGDERVLVFIHGTNTASNCWGEVMTEFHKLGYTVISVDLPAFGISDCDQSLQNKDACEILQYYDKVLYNYFVKRNIVNCILIGHSFGGFIASHVASNHPDLFSHLP